MKIITCSLFVALCTTLLLNAQIPVPAKTQSGPIALTGGIAHLGNGLIIQNSIITFDKGILTLIADGSSVTPDLTGHQVIEITGKHVYPGFILPNSQIGLQEVSAIRAMNDAVEEGEMNPSVRSLISYNTDSEYIATFRFNGVLLAETTPTGGTISGTSSVMEMDGWNWEDAVHTADIGIHLNWPEQLKKQFDYTAFAYIDTPNKEYDNQVTAIENFFADASSYSLIRTKEVNLKFEAMQGLFDGQKTVFIHANTPKEIIESIRSMQKRGVSRITLVGGEGALWVAEFLKENKIPVILPTTTMLPARADDDVDLPYKLPHLLTAAGVMVSIGAKGMLHDGRNLGFHAGIAAGYGMDKEEALKTITSNTAKALGIDSRVGTLEKGKDATLFISEGDALDCRSNILSYAFIRGKSVTLPGDQQALYERFSRKYGLTK